MNTCYKDFIVISNLAVISLLLPALITVWKVTAQVQVQQIWPIWLRADMTEP